MTALAKALRDFPLPTMNDDIRRIIMRDVRKRLNVIADILDGSVADEHHEGV